MMVAIPPPYSQVLSVRFGAPSAGLPLASSPWQAVQPAAVNFGLPSAARVASCAASRQRQHVVGEVLDFVGRADCGAHRRHHALAPTGDRGLDRLGVAAPLPVAVGEVREAAAAARVRTVALHAISQVQALADLARLRVGGDGGNVLGKVFREQRRDHLVGARDLALVLALLAPAERALPGAEARIHREVGEREHAGDQEQPQPPARQRVVVFLERLVPSMPGRADLRARRVPPGEHQRQPDAERNRKQRDDRDEEAPACTGEVGHVRLLRF